MLRSLPAAGQEQPSNVQSSGISKHDGEGPAELQPAAQDNEQDQTSPKSGLRGLLSGMMDNKFVSLFLDESSDVPSPYFSAGFGLMGLGAVLAVARRAAVQGAGLARRRLLVSLEISSKDPAYLWFLQWMEAHGEKHAHNARSFFAAGVRSHQLAVETTTSTQTDGGTSTFFSLVPGPGVHYMKYRQAYFQVRRERDGKMMDLTSGTPWETVTLTALSRDRRLFPHLLQEARELADKAKIGRTVIYTAWGAEWRPFGQPRTRRLLGSVILDENVKERVVNDVTEFMQRGQWYADRGIPYRRGYLLHGPPGSGKSSFIQALAGSLSYNIAILNLSERGLTDDKLNHLLANAPQQTIILLEDIDAAFSRRDQTDEHGFRGAVTFSGLLNALDGVASSMSQRILFMTTNHVENLDPALVRPGRVDLQELLDDATPYQAGQLFRRFYSGEQGLNGGQLDALQQQLEEIIASSRQTQQRISMAALQGIFIRSSAEDILENCKSALQEQRQAAAKNITPSMPA